MTITILGKKFPVEYTIKAQKEIAEKYGDTLFSGNSDDSFKGASKTLEEIAGVLAILMKAAEERERVRCAMYGEEFSGPDALTVEQVLVAVSPAEIPTYQDAIMACLKGGNKTTVEIVPEKNGKATP